MKKKKKHPWNLPYKLNKDPQSRDLGDIRSIISSERQRSLKEPYGIRGRLKQKEIMDNETLTTL